jgi:trehalose 6-phosphate synthase/phosphatase
LQQLPWLGRGGLERAATCPFKPLRSASNRAEPVSNRAPPGYEPVHYLERHVPLHERIAFLSVADVAVVTATRDGMNLLPYEYVVCR